MKKNMKDVELPEHMETPVRQKKKKHMITL